MKESSSGNIGGIVAPINPRNREEAFIYGGDMDLTQLKKRLKTGYAKLTRKSRIMYGKVRQRKMRQRNI